MNVEKSTLPDCIECSKRDVFGHREIESIDKCECNIDIKESTWEFLRYCRYYNLLLMIKNAESCPPIEGLINRLVLLNYNQLIESFYPVKNFNELSSKFYRKIRKYHRKWSKNDFLDVGCGNMIFTRRLAYMLSTVSRGVDIIDNRLTKEQDDRFSIYDGTSIPYKDESIKFVTLIHVLHHIEDPDDLLKEIYRVLKPGGIFIIGEFDCRNWKEAYSLNLYHFSMNKVLNTAPSTCWYRSLSQWSSIITGVGFEHLPKETFYDSLNVYNWGYNFYRKPRPRKESRWDEKPEGKKEETVNRERNVNKET